MIRKKHFGHLLICGLSLAACQSDNSNVYQVNATGSQAIVVDGKKLDSAWDNAIVMEDFQYPWRSTSPPKTIFRALHSPTHLYLIYEVEDEEIITPDEGLGEQDVVQSDRVEIFLKSEDNNAPYYALELDALGRVLDTKGTFNNPVDFGWQWPKGHLEVKSTMTENGYILEVGISKASLKQLDLWAEEEDYIHAGVYRGEYVQIDQPKPQVKWISWIDPQTPNPKFHTPTSFGKFKLK